MEDTTAKQLRPERVDKKGVMTYLPEEMAIRLKVIAAQEQTTIQKIGLQAFTEWLAKRDASSSASGDDGGVLVEMASNKSKSSVKPASSLKRRA